MTPIQTASLVAGEKTAEQIARGLTEAARTAVSHMMAYKDSDTPCLSAKHLAERAGITVGEARKVGPELTTAGVAEHESGLVTEDGDFYGSGWCLTEVVGLRVRAILTGAA